MKTIIIILAVVYCLSAFVVVNIQDRVIEQQRHMIEEMISNPACTEPPATPIISDN